MNQPNSNVGVVSEKVSSPSRGAKSSKNSLWHHYSQLTKFGIVAFVLITALAGYAVSFPMGNHWEWARPIWLMVGLFFISSGSFILNQVQEWKLDQKMPRTHTRPIAAGLIAPWQGAVVSVVFFLLGSLILYPLHSVTAGLALLTVLLYNGFYTLWWKRHWTFGAVPGAIPGAMPVVIGYSVNNPNVLSADCVYLFVVMFLWQMPHFWCLAIRYKDDYKAGSIPVLPLTLGVDRTLYHIGLYTFTYVAVALTAPWFLESQVMYIFFSLPIALKLLWEFVRYFRGQLKKENQWLPFFLWVNFSMLVFVVAPAAERWLTFWLRLPAN